MLRLLARPRLWPRLWLRSTERLLALAGLALVCLGFSAHATRIALQEPHAAKPVAAIAPAGFDLQDHFPGAALFYPTDEALAPVGQAAPAVGATGTIALPDLPAGAELHAGDTSVRPAPPFNLAGASSTARARALQCLATAIYYEAASESEEGQRAVAQVILNRARHPAFPASVCGVVYQGSEKAGCQFSFACDGSLARLPSHEGMARATRYAAEALAGRVVPSVGMATHYHTYAVTPSWNRTLVMTATIGAHLFHRWKGYWGTPGAFTQRYALAEPVPGPKPRAQLASTAMPAVVPDKKWPAPDARPAYADSGQAKPAVAPTVTEAAGALPESTILDKWKGTGEPLR